MTERQIERSAGGEFPVTVELLASDPLVAGRGNVVFALGSARAARGELRDLGLSLGPHRASAIAEQVPIDGGSEGSPSRSRTGFWAMVEIPAGAQGELEIALDGAVDGDRLRAELGPLAVVADEPAPHAGPAAGASIAIAMATYEPPADLFRAQIESIRAQTRDDWICVISDDASTPERVDDMRAVLGDDPRFRFSRAQTRGGFYRNFERALLMVPPEVDYVAFADQDDRWRPDKLARLLAAIGDANLVYSDAQILDEGGAVVSPTYWVGRRNNYTNLASLVIANTITGAASLFRRDLLDHALPFPSGPGPLYHDHWIALVALACGEVRYIDEPLYDYVQHSGAFLGHAAANALELQRESVARRIATARSIYPRTLRAWRRYYFEEHIRTQLLARVLRLRCGARLAPRKRATLDLLLRGERSPLTLGWLGLRSLRTLIGRDETLGVERGILRGVAWRWMLPAAGMRPGFPRPTLAIGDHADPLATASPARRVDERS